MSFILTLFFSSLFYFLVYDDYIPQPGMEIRYDDEGQLLKSPFTPIDHPPFGTDPKGRDLFFIMLVGAKYTIVKIEMHPFLEDCLMITSFKGNEL